MLDTTNLKLGARLRMISTNEGVDFVGVSATENMATVIRVNGLTQDVNLSDLELVAL